MDDWTCRADEGSCAARKGPDIGKRPHSIRSEVTWRPKQTVIYRPFALGAGREGSGRRALFWECAVARHPYNARNLLAPLPA